MRVGTSVTLTIVSSVGFVLGCAGDGNSDTLPHPPSSGGSWSGGASSGGRASGGGGVPDSGWPSTGGGAAGASGSGQGGSAGVAGSAQGGSAGAAPQCSLATTPCTDKSQCCGNLDCANTSLGQVCCGNEGESCATANGEDCCGALLCVNGKCGYGTDPGVCASPCKAAPGLVIEKDRLAAIGGNFLGICGDANHTYGYHVPAALLPSSDYSLQGALNIPTCVWHAYAIDIGMNWPAARTWLKWLIPQIASDGIKGIAEVIGSYDGVNVRYWSDKSGWSTNGIPYTGSGHDTWTHVAIYRSTGNDDHHILSGWTATGGP